ncbi:7538_t:CDS:2, partial [Funneliformis geosporum]
MVAVEGLSSDISDEEQKDHKEFKYKEKKISFLKELKLLLIEIILNNLSIKLITDEAIIDNFSEAITGGIDTTSGHSIILV